MLFYLVSLYSWTTSPYPSFSSDSAVYESKHSDFKGRTVANDLPPNYVPESKTKSEREQITSKLSLLFAVSVSMLTGILLTPLLIY